MFKLSKPSVEDNLLPVATREVTVVLRDEGDDLDLTQVKTFATEGVAMPLAGITSPEVGVDILVSEYRKSVFSKGLEVKEGDWVPPSRIIRFKVGALVMKAAESI